MRVAFYNQMFALNGRPLFGNLLGHLAVHFQSNEKKVWNKTDLSRTLEIIEKSNADIIGIAEILEGQEKELEEKLKKLGYNYFFFSKGHKTKFRDLHVIVAIASKIKCVMEGVEGFPMKNEMGGGGGFIRCYIPSLKTSVINLHLANVKKKVFGKQIRFLQDLLKERKEKIILIGDFNISYSKFKNVFKDLDLISKETKTCSTTPLFKLFSYKDLDHIFVKGFKGKNIGDFRGYSDHKLIYADLK
jgi:endonuclease/exonuclease/phosphatase family metal-dependent hydrolase